MKTGSSPCGADVLTVGPGTDLFVVGPGKSDLFTVGPGKSGCFSAAIRCKVHVRVFLDRICCHDGLPLT